MKRFLRVAWVAAVAGVFIFGYYSRIYEGVWFKLVMTDVCLVIPGLIIMSVWCAVKGAAMDIAIARDAEVRRLKAQLAAAATSHHSDGPAPA